MGTQGAETRFAIDAVTALRLIDDDPRIGAQRRLVAPSLLRSEVSALLYRDLRDGMLDEASARERLDALATLRIRLLSDRVSRATAWKIASRLGWPDPRPAEYLAVAVLQADVFVAGDGGLAAGAADIVTLASYDDLVGRGGERETGA